MLCNIYTPNFPSSYITCVMKIMKPNIPVTGKTLLSHVTLNNPNIPTTGEKPNMPVTGMTALSWCSITICITNEASWSSTV